MSGSPAVRHSPAMRFAPANLGVQFNRLWVACAAASTADGLRYAALPLAAAAVTRDPKMVAFVSAAGFAPSLLSIPVGVAVDRAGARRILQGSAGTQAVAYGLLAAAMLVGAAPVLVLCVAAFLFGAGEVATDIAVESLPGQLVNEAVAPAAFGRISATELTIEDIAGPAVAGLLFVLSPAAPFVAAALAAAIAVMAAGRIRRLPAATEHVDVEVEPPKRVWQDVREGFSWLRDRPRLMGLYGAMAASAMAGTAGEAVLVLFMLDVIGVPGAAFGVVLAIAAVGAVSGAAGSPWFVGRFGSARTVSWALAVAAVFWFLMGVSSAWLAAVVYLTVGTAAISTARVAATSMRQAEATDAVRGRAASLYRSSMLLAQFGGALIGGAVASTWGVRGPFVAGAPVVLLAAVGLGAAARRGRAVGAPRPVVNEVEAP